MHRIFIKATLLYQHAVQPLSEIQRILFQFQSALSENEEPDLYKGFCFFYGLEKDQILLSQL